MRVVGGRAATLGKERWQKKIKKLKRQAT